MADLRFADKKEFEKLFGMSSGYVLDFSNRTFQEFVWDSVSRDIYDVKYTSGHSGSKANLLRKFWKEEPNQIVGKLLTDLVAHSRRPDWDSTNAALATACGEIARQLIGDAPENKNNPLVFISYARPDIRVVKALDEMLRQAGLLTWFDKKDLRGGEDWERIIRHRIAEAKIVVVCLSSRAVNRKGYFHKEMRVAINEAAKLPKGTVFVVPIRIDDCEVPDDLQQWHVIDLFKPLGSYDLLKSISDALDLDVRVTTESHEAFAKTIKGCFPFCVREGMEFNLSTRLLGHDRCMYEVNVSGAMLGSESAKFLLRVHKHIVGRPVELVHEDSYGLMCGESIPIVDPWQLSLEEVDKQEASFVINQSDSFAK